MIATLPTPAVVCLLGAAGAGKSTWASRHFLPSQILCLDRLRELVADDECDQDATGDAVAVLDVVLRARLRRRLITVLDATNAEAVVRAELVALAAAHQMPAVAVVLDTPLEVCLARQAARPGPEPRRRWGRAVPPEVVRRQHAEVAAATAGLAAEGFAHVCVLDPFTTASRDADMPAGGTSPEFLGREARS
jgi:predicted kinase